MNDAERRDPAVWGDVHVQPGEGREVRLVLSETYAGADIGIPIYVWRGAEPGPTVYVTAAVHGDEINGTGAIRHIIMEELFTISRGTLILAPVINLLGFERHSRYLPDRRDLNRCFPGSPEGSVASRIASTIFRQIVKRSDFGIDLHTAAIRRTNFPNVRADMSDPRIADFARAFGAELIVSGRGPQGSLRRAACAAGCATIILEAGEVWKVERYVVEYAARGVRNCLIHLGMVEGEAEKPSYRVETDRTKWIRAKHGGFLHFRVAPGDILEAGQVIATNTSLTGQEQGEIVSPRDGVVLGMTTLPSVAPGDPVCHLAFPSEGNLKHVERAVEKLSEDCLHQRMREDLSHGVVD